MRSNAPELSANWAQSSSLWSQRRRRRRCGRSKTSRDRRSAPAAGHTADCTSTYGARRARHPAGTGDEADHRGSVRGRSISPAPRWPPGSADTTPDRGCRTVPRPEAYQSRLTDASAVPGRRTWRLDREKAAPPPRASAGYVSGHPVADGRHGEAAGLRSWSLSGSPLPSPLPALPQTTKQRRMTTRSPDRRAAAPYCYEPSRAVAAETTKHTIIAASTSSRS